MNLIFLKRESEPKLYTQKQILFFKALSLICHDYADYQVKDFAITRETAGDDYNVCALHHEALKRGYVGVNKIIISPYEGKFGKGYTLDKNNPRSTQYCIREYWIYD